MDNEQALLRSKPECRQYIADSLANLLGRDVAVKDLEVNPVLGYPPFFDFLPKVSTALVGL
jgi:hypothetical protein